MIGLIAHSEKPAAASVVAAMIAELERFNMSYLLERSTAPLVGKSSAFDESALAAQCRLLVVMGGDGTILRVVQKLTDVLPPIFGINIGIFDLPRRGRDSTSRRMHSSPGLYPQFPWAFEGGPPIRQR